MRRFIGLALALIMAITVYSVPAVSSYADDENLTQGTEEEQMLNDGNDQLSETDDEEEAEDVDASSTQADGEGIGQEPSSEEGIESENTEQPEAVQKAEGRSVREKGAQELGAASEAAGNEKNKPKETTKRVALARVAKVNLVSREAYAVSLNWTKVKGAKGYKVYRKLKNNKWKEVADVKSAQKGTVVEDLVSSRGHKFKIIAYNSSYKPLSSDKGTEVYAVTKPGKVHINSVKKTFPTLRANWDKRRGSGYEIWVSKSSKFKTKKKIIVNSKSKVSKKLGKLKNNKKYYVKVRAFYKFKGHTYKGKWSRTVSCKVKSTGWKKTNGRKYYYGNGSLYKGYHKFKGTKLYFDKKTGELHGTSKTMWNKVKGKSSRTKYLVSVSRKSNRYVVYKKYDGHWCVYKYGLCTTGAPSTPSPKGCFSTTGRDKISFGNGFTCWYATNIVGQVYFHSVICGAGTKRASGGQLGRSLSHGCIRLSLSDANWIYKNIHKGTKVVIL